MSKIYTASNLHLLDIHEFELDERSFFILFRKIRFLKKADEIIKYCNMAKISAFRLCMNLNRNHTDSIGVNTISILYEKIQTIGKDFERMKKCRKHMNNFGFFMRLSNPQIYEKEEFLELANNILANYKSYVKQVSVLNNQLIR